MPEPDERTPWQDIIDFRADPDAKHELIALRRWMRKVNSESLRPAEIAQELDYLLNEYERYMQLHHIKVNKGFLETVVTVTGEVLEHIAKLRFGALAKVPFAVRARHIALREAELTAPGREVAYITRVRSEFAYGQNTEHTVLDGG